MNVFLYIATRNRTFVPLNCKDFHLQFKYFLASKMLLENPLEVLQESVSWVMSVSAKFEMIKWGQNLTIKQQKIFFNCTKIVILSSNQIQGLC